MIMMIIRIIILSHGGIMIMIMVIISIIILSHGGHLLVAAVKDTVLVSSHLFCSPLAFPNNILMM